MMKCQKLIYSEAFKLHENWPSLTFNLYTFYNET